MSITFAISKRLEMGNRFQEDEDKEEKVFQPVDHPVILIK